MRVDFSRLRLLLGGAGARVGGARAARAWARGALSLGGDHATRLFGFGGRTPELFGYRVCSKAWSGWGGAAIES